MDERQRYLFDTRGYLVLEGALTADETERLRKALTPLPPSLVRDPPGGVFFRGFLEAPEPLFRSLIDHPSILRLLRELMPTSPTGRLSFGDHPLLSHEYGMRMGAGEAGLPLHGGAAPHDPALAYAVHGGRPFCNMLSVLWALSDALEGDGGFCCIPGSHRAAFPLPAGLDPADPAVVQPALRAGSALLFTEALAHGTRPWRAGHDRLALFYKYVPAHLGAWALARPASVLAKMEPGQLSFLRHDA